MTSLDTLKEALMAFRDNDLSLARDLCETLLKQNSNDVGALRILGQICFIEGNLEGAETHLEKTLKAKPDQYSVWLKLGDIKAELGNHKKAIEVYTKAREYNPDPDIAYLSRAASYSALGQDKEAWTDLTEAARINPAMGQTYRMMMLMEHPATQDAEWEQSLLERLMNRMFQREDAIQVHYALAAYYEKAGDAGRMWDNLKKANGLQKNLSQPWAEGYENMIARSKEIFTTELIDQLATKAKQTLTPIFIVGIPRSGSTLLEQMLSRHPEISAAGETNGLTGVLGELQGQITLLPYPEGLDMAEKEDMTALTKGYQNTLEKSALGKTFVTDKLLSNGFFVGFIKMILPWAKVIHITRNPLDNAFSIYKNYFLEAQNPEFCSLKDIGIYARLMDGIMSHWAKIMPGFVHQVAYENLVKDPEARLKEILEFIGLPWDAKCLEPEGAEKRAETLSSTQASKPLFSTSIGQGEKFQEELAAFQTAFSTDAN